MNENEKLEQTSSDESENKAPGSTVEKTPETVVKSEDVKNNLKDDNKELSEEEANKQIADKKKSRKGNWFKAIFFIVVTVVALSVILTQFGDIDEVWHAVVSVDGKWMWAAVGCLLAYQLLYPLSLVVISKFKKLKVSTFESYLIGSSEHFFNGVTPFATGGQPFQILAYTKAGVSASESTGLIMMNFISFLVATNLFALVSLFFYGQFSARFNSSTSWIIFLGFTMNFFTLAFLICMATSKWVRDMFSGVLRGLCKIKFIGKYLSKAVPVFDKYCENAQIAAKACFSNWPLFLGSIIIKIVDLTFYYAIPFFILKAMDLQVSWSQLYLYIFATSFAITTMVWVPTPGGTGGIEMAFNLIFAAIVVGINDNVVQASMLVWRFLTYYLLMLISFLQYAGLGLVTKSRVKKQRLKEIEDKKEGEQSC